MKFIHSKIVILIVGILIPYNYLFSQSIEAIYSKLPEEYLRTSPLYRQAQEEIEKPGSYTKTILNREKLRNLLKLETAEINNQYHNQSLNIKTKIIDKKNNYLQICDYGCAWEFVMKVFNTKNNKQKYVAIWSGDNDGATTGTNKLLKLLAIDYNKNTLTFKDVTDPKSPVADIKDIIGLSAYKKYQKLLDTLSIKPKESLLTDFTIDRYQPMISAQTDPMIIIDLNLESLQKNSTKETDIIRDLLYYTTVTFKWDGENFKLIKKEYKK